MTELTLPGQIAGLLRRISRQGHAESDVVSDEILATRVRATGDTEAFSLLVTRYRGRLIALAHRMLADKHGDTDEAEDVAQEAFVAAYDKRRSYRPDFPYRPWLYRIALNRCLDRLRVHSRRPRSESWDETLSEFVGEPEPLTALLTSEREARLEQAVSSLPPMYRAVFLLRTLDDLSYEEIAVAVGMPLGTVKTHLFRARALLRDALRDYWSL
jgi:RNA polymerase sigma-70 factor (ECF subfamily)